MRVLNPRVRNPLYRLYDRMNQTIGDGGTLTTIGALGLAAPVGSGIFVNGVFAFGAVAGAAGLLSFAGYAQQTKQKARLTKLVTIKKQLPAGYHKIIDPLISEVFECSNSHYSFKRGTKGLQYTHDSSGYSQTHYLDRETNAEWKIRDAQEELLTLGHSCEYCGQRVQAAQLLLEECKTAQVDDDSSVQTVLRVVDSQREANKQIAAVRESTRQAYKELTQ
jgi:hypothetical protein